MSVEDDCYWTTCQNITSSEGASWAGARMCDKFHLPLDSNMNILLPLTQNFFAKTLPEMNEGRRGATESKTETQHSLCLPDTCNVNEDAYYMLYMYAVFRDWPKAVSA